LVVEVHHAPGVGGAGVILGGVAKGFLGHLAPQWRVGHQALDGGGQIQRSNAGLYSRFLPGIKEVPFVGWRKTRLTRSQRIFLLDSAMAGLYAPGDRQGLRKAKDAGARVAVERASPSLLNRRRRLCRGVHFQLSTPEKESNAIMATNNKAAGKAMGKTAKTQKARGAKGETLGVIGLGYVGLPLVVEMANAGFRVIGFDVDARKVDGINAGRSHVEDIAASVLAPLVRSGQVHATTDFADLAKVACVSICVPTPLRKTKDPDISYIMAAVEQIRQRLRKGQTIILESTTYPGTTDEAVLPVLESTGLVVGEDFFLAFSPERVDPGNATWHTRNTPKIVGGLTAKCLKMAIKYYGRVFEKIVPVSSTRCAELVKLLENTFRSVNIGMVNEMALMCNKLGLDVWEVIEAASTKPFGFMPFYPGPGLGGHCIPIDPHYLSWKLKTLNYQARFIEMAGEINGGMPAYVVQKVADALNDESKPVKGSKILVLGVAYKKNVGDVRESPAIDVIRLLEQRGADMAYHDPYVAALHEEGINLKSVDLTDARLKKADCVVVVTDHAAINYARVAKLAKLVMDTRNALKAIKAPKARVVKL
jgi:UDP-N-acetyl-D-glucosamine dehydrogenase